MSEELIPSGVNLNRLKKDEILWLYNHRCEHSKRFTEHPACYKGELAIPEKIGFIDIETTGLQAQFGYIFCFSLKELDGKIVHRLITPQEIRTYKFDKGVIIDFLKAIKGYDRLVGYYSKDNRFDMPFLRTRALKWGLDFPGWRDILFTDVYDLIRPKLKLNRNRMEVACELLGIPSKQHRLTPEVWQRAQAGSPKALAYILKHCDEDVVSLEALYKRVKGFGRPSRVSI
jgi:uncharacterized protein YprB with RNaseH-like and TPR domain